VLFLVFDACFGNNNNENICCGFHGGENGVEAGCLLPIDIPTLFFYWHPSVMEYCLHCVVLSHHIFGKNNNNEYS
jgi:hypothetical protein